MVIDARVACFLLIDTRAKFDELRITRKTTRGEARNAFKTRKTAKGSSWTSFS